MFLGGEGARFWGKAYGEVARKFGITSPEFYVCMAQP